MASNEYILCTLHTSQSVHSIAIKREMESATDLVPDVAESNDPPMLLNQQKTIRDDRLSIRRARHQNDRLTEKEISWKNMFVVNADLCTIQKKAIRIMESNPVPRLRIYPKIGIALFAALQSRFSNPSEKDC